MAQNLKPQDVVVLVKLCGYETASRPPYSVLADDLEMSQAEVNASVKRLQQARLLHPKEMGEMPIMAAVEEFLIHGVKYAFPVTRRSLARGMATSYAAPPLNEMIVQGSDPIPVWPDPRGKERGLSLLPLYKSVPNATRRDPLLYARLAMLDAIRDGGARQVRIAERELIKSLRQKNGKF